VRYFHTSESFFNPSKKSKASKKKKQASKIKNPIDAEQNDQAASQTLDEIAYRASQAHGLNQPAGNPDFK